MDEGEKPKYLDLVSTAGDMNPGQWPLISEEVKTKIELLNILIPSVNQEYEQLNLEYKPKLETKPDSDVEYLIELKREADQYGIKPASMELWRQMRQWRPDLTWDQICALLNIEETKMKYHRKKMKAAGYID